MREVLFGRWSGMRCHHERSTVWQVVRSVLPPGEGDSVVTRRGRQCCHQERETVLSPGERDSVVTRRGRQCCHQERETVLSPGEGDSAVTRRGRQCCHQERETVLSPGEGDSAVTRRGRQCCHQERETALFAHSAHLNPYVFCTVLFNSRQYMLPSTIAAESVSFED